MNSQYTGEQVETLLGTVNTIDTNYEKKTWVGTESEYSALSDKDSDRLYIITE